MRRQRLTRFQVLLGVIGFVVLMGIVGTIEVQESECVVEYNNYVVAGR